MDDLYSREFPPAARAKVKAKKILAARDFEERKPNLRWAAEIEVALRTYILRVFLSFAEEAFELGRQGVWSVDQVEEQVARVPPPDHHRGRGGEGLGPLATPTAQHDRPLGWRHPPRSPAGI